MQGSHTGSNRSYRLLGGVTEITTFLLHLDQSVCRRFWERSVRVYRFLIAHPLINHGLHVYCKGLREQAKEMEQSEVSHLPHQE